MLFDFKTFFQSLWDSCDIYREWVIGCSLLILLFYIIHRYHLVNSPIKTSCNDLGELFVTRNAILRLIDGVSKSMKIGRITRIKLQDKKHTLNIRLHIRLYANQSFDAISMQFQENVKETITKSLGVVKSMRVDVVLDGIEKNNEEVNLDQKN